MRAVAKAAIVDSGVWIAAKHASDQYYEKAARIISAWEGNSIGYVFITDYVVVETANFLLRKTSFETALEAVKMLTESERIRVRYVDKLMYAAIMRLFQQYKSLSIADCSLIALAEEEGISTIFSFDTTFDKVKGISRRETP